MAEGLTISSSSSLSDMSAIAIASAIANVEPAGPSAQLVSRYDLEKGQKQVNIPLWSRLTAAALTEGVMINAPQQVAVTVKNLTASEHGLLTFLSDRLTRQNNENIVSEVGQFQGLGVGRLREQDVIALYDAVTGLSIPGAGNAGNFRHIAGAVAYLKTDNSSAQQGPAPGKVNGIFHPEQIRRFVQEATSVQAGGSVGMAAQPIPTGMTADIVENYFRGNEQLFNTRIWESGLIERDGSGDSKGCVHVPQAFALGMHNEITAESMRVPRLRGEDLVTTAEWGEIEINDEWAVEFYSAADVIS
jgi:hypothetical protein